MPGSPHTLPSVDAPAALGATNSSSGGQESKHHQKKHQHHHHNKKQRPMPASKRIQAEAEGYRENDSFYDALGDKVKGHRRVRGPPYVAPILQRATARAGRSDRGARLACCLCCAGTARKGGGETAQGRGSCGPQVGYRLY
jgi:hypothetical protein